MADEVIGSVKWELDLDDKKFKSGLDNASDKIKGISKSFEGATKASNAFALGLAGIGAGLVAFGVKSVAAFNEADQVQTRLSKLILNQTGATMKNVDALNKQAAAMEQVTTFGDDMVTMAQSQFATFDLSSEAIMKVIPGFLDMVAAEKGATISMEEMKLAAQGMGKAMIGQTDALVKQGFIFTELQKQILKTGTETERLNVITEVMGKTYGGMAEAMRNTFQGQMTVAQNTLGNFMELIGKAISERITPLIAAFNKWADSMGGAEGMMRKLNEAGKVLGEWLPVIVGVIMFGLAPAVAAAALSFTALMVPLLPFIAAGATLGLVVKLLIDHFGGLNNTMRLFKQGIEVVHEKWTWLMDSFKSGLELIKELSQALGGVLSKSPNSYLMEKISGIFGGARAMGGSVDVGKSYLVGENGPEMFVPNKSGTIIPNGISNGTFNFYISEKVDMKYVLEQVNAHLGNKSIQSSLGIS